jgi:hypothetical protein
VAYKLDDSKEYYLNLQPEDFESFKNDLKVNDKKGAYRLVHLQKLAYRLTKSVIDTGVDSYGNKLTDEEIEGSKLILKQLVSNYETLKEEYDYIEKG